MEIILLNHLCQEKSRLRLHQNPGFSTSLGLFPGKKGGLGGGVGGFSVVKKQGVSATIMERKKYGD
jgi:hypothetical protein